MAITVIVYSKAQVLFSFSSSLYDFRELQQAVITGKIEPEASFINASVVGGLLPLQVAAHKALVAHARGCMTTRLLHSELVFNLSPSKHISEGLKRYGIGEDTRHLLVARFDATQLDMDALRGLVSGAPAPISDLEALVDKSLLSKARLLMLFAGPQTPQGLACARGSTCMGALHGRPARYALPASSPPRPFSGAAAWRSEQRAEARHAPP